MLRQKKKPFLGLKKKLIYQILVIALQVEGIFFSVFTTAILKSDEKMPVSV